MDPHESAFRLRGRTRTRQGQGQRTKARNQGRRTRDHRPGQSRESIVPRTSAVLCLRWNLTFSSVSGIGFLILALECLMSNFGARVPFFKRWDPDCLPDAKPTDPVLSSALR